MVVLDRASAISLVRAEGSLLDRVLAATYPICNGGLSRQAYARFHAARSKTAWGSRCQRHVALMDGPMLLAGAAHYDLAGVCDGRPLRVCGIGSLFAEPARQGFGYAQTLVETLLDQAARDGAEIALLFSTGSDEAHALTGFEAIPLVDVVLDIADTKRPGAPMTLVRGGEERDLAAIVAMGRVRDAPFRFHLDRDADQVQYAITGKRLLAGLGAVDARQLHFFIAEEGITAAAYVVVSIAGSQWTFEECGDRDPCGARVGALLQALVARAPVERRPTISGWLPSRFAPPQTVIVSTRPSTTVMMARGLNGRALPRLDGDDVLYWRSDVF
jgi:GNAT superfamily N-acetyltransferase